MDGGGRLDQPLTRSGPQRGSRSAATLASVRASPRSGSRLARAGATSAAARSAGSAAWRGLPSAMAIGRWLACGSHGCRRRAASASPPRLLLLAATLGYGAVPAAMSPRSSIGSRMPATWPPMPLGFRIAAVALTGPEASQPRRNSDHRRRDRPRLAAVPRCRRGARPAHDQSLDRRRDRAQALSRPAADHHHRAAGLRAVAEGRPRRRHRRRRHGARALRR